MIFLTSTEEETGRVGIRNRNTGGNLKINTFQDKLKNNKIRWQKHI
jgi:hypothetical protein